MMQRPLLLLVIRTKHIASTGHLEEHSLLRYRSFRVKPIYNNTIELQWLEP